SVSGTYLQVLGVTRSPGRMLTPADDEPGAPPVVVVSFEYWRRALNGDRSAVGTTLEMNGAAVAIVGVAPQEFYGDRIEPDPPSFWLPVMASRTLNPTGNLVGEPDSHWLYLFGRLAPAVAAPQAQERLTIVLQNWFRTRAGASMSAPLRARIAATRVELRAMTGGMPRLA